MNYILFDGSSRNGLLPLTYTKPVAELRIGILTIREKWEKILNSTTTTITEEYLQEKFPMVELDENILINASFLPNEEFIKLINNLSVNQAIIQEEEIVAFYTQDSQEEINFDNYEIIEIENLTQLKHGWDIFRHNEEALKFDFNLLTEGRTSEPIPDTVNIINKDQIFWRKVLKSILQF